MKNDELLKTHAEYGAMLERWRFWMAAYEGASALVAAGALTRHPREDAQSYRDRCNEAVGFNYSRSIVHLFGNYLFEKPPMRDLGGLAEDSLWQAFEADCDLFGSDFAAFLVEQQKYASVYGHVGVLVDTPGRGAMTRKEEREHGVYPYVAAYHPEAILDWAYEREEGGRPRLAWVKLLEEDGTVLVYGRERWERWRPAETRAGAVAADAELVSGGEHPLGQVPFVWLMNIRGRRRNIGVSDIADIALLDASILRDLSLGSEVIKNSAFPMFRTPKQPPDASGEREVEVGPRAVLEWDPEYENGAKQDWLEAAAREPIEAILLWTSKKAEEIYRMANAGGLNATQVSGEAKSGVALRQEFQLLNTVLAAKANNLEEAERAIIGLWLAWQGRGGEVGRISVERPRNFSVEDLAADLENAARGAELIAESPTFQAEIKMLMAKRLLPKGGAVLERIRTELQPPTE
ncbi:hypothetical protein [Oceanidesulfovibrio marinus]|uniref:Phage portal protein n=1 Tax=Oceanidesulfovibrio marinus TaxID=370038 RepID=A0A6P1ZIY4_9BACT|nr:hypothetical protein [Oceanidesulfovibrio marinus]TVM34627.1 hypothetical protein DQK91_08630 [Oceanidesulfovibrio marinus]